MPSRSCRAAPRPSCCPAASRTATTCAAARSPASRRCSTPYAAFAAAGGPGARDLQRLPDPVRGRPAARRAAPEPRPRVRLPRRPAARGAHRHGLHRPLRAGPGADDPGEERRGELVRRRRALRRAGGVGPARAALRGGLQRLGRRRGGRVQRGAERVRPDAASRARGRSAARLGRRRAPARRARRRRARAHASPPPDRARSRLRAAAPPRVRGASRAPRAAARGPSPAASPARAARRRRLRRRSGRAARPCAVSSSWTSEAKRLSPACCGSFSSSSSVAAPHGVAACVAACVSPFMPNATERPATRVQRLRTETETIAPPFSPYAKSDLERRDLVRARQRARAHVQRDRGERPALPPDPRARQRPDRLPEVLQEGREARPRRRDREGLRDLEGQARRPHRRGLRRP